MKFDFDVIVIGAGSGGLTVAIGLAQAGKKVALVEQWLIGGDCTNYGCVPSKAFLDIAHAGEIKGIQRILQEVRKRRQKIQNEETPKHIESYGLKVYQARASFKSDHEVCLSDAESITWKYIVIATWSHAQKWSISWILPENIHNNKTIFEIEADIKSIAIIGGGYIGCELAEAFCLSWVEVHLIQRNQRLIPREEKTSSQFLEAYFKKIGVHIYTQAQVIEGKNGNLYISQEQNNVKKTIEIPCDTILEALGRIPNIEWLNCEKAGVEADDKGIPVDAYLRTSKKHIFAIGDIVKNNPQFTHLANHQGRNVIRNILVPLVKVHTQKSVLPSCLYTHYEIARVGKTQQELQEELPEDEYRMFQYTFENNDRSKVTEDTEGFVMIHVARVTWKILGTTIVGKTAGEILPIFTLAMEKNISAYALAKMMFAYPTKAEVVKKVCDQFVLSTLKNIQQEMIWFLKKNILRYLPVFLWLCILGCFLVYKQMYHLTLEDIALNLYRMIAHTGTLWIAIYIGAYALRPIVLFPASFMTFMAGAIWWPFYGLLYAVIGSNMGGQVGYFMGKVLGKSIIWKKQISTLTTTSSRSDFLKVLGGRLLFLPYDSVSYVAGFLWFQWLQYSLWTLFWTFLWSVTFVLAGSSFYGISINSFADAVKNINISILYGAAVVFIVSIGASKVLKKYF
jgi:pyruvate/2-oxoglutarate dehydrogenase complex dihydrolipoamide dehydrogenase (E3) component/uncharacterized membrane protein YdjX (TVP38/TMEM64 family)